MGTNDLMLANLHTVQELSQRFNEQRWTEFDDLCTEQVQLMHPVTGTPVATIDRERFSQRPAALARKFPGIKEQILYIEAGHDRVYVQSRITARDPSGKPWQQNIWMVFSMLVGKITAITLYAMPFALEVSDSLVN